VPASAPAGGVDNGIAADRALFLAGGSREPVSEPTPDGGTRWQLPAGAELASGRTLRLDGDSFTLELSGNLDCLLTDNRPSGFQDYLWAGYFSKGAVPQGKKYIIETAIRIAPKWGAASGCYCDRIRHGRAWSARKMNEPRSRDFMIVACGAEGRGVPWPWRGAWTRLRNQRDKPDVELLRWHNESVYKAG